MLFPACMFLILATRALNPSAGVSNTVNLSHSTFLPPNPVSIIFQGLKFLTAGVLPYFCFASSLSIVAHCTGVHSLPFHCTVTFFPFTSISFVCGASVGFVAIFALYSGLL